MAAKTGKRASESEARIVHLRMPSDIHAWLEKSAQAEYGTMTAKVVRCLAAEMQRERETKKAGA
jgi:hypothetical protein